MTDAHKPVTTLSDEDAATIREIERRIQERDTQYYLFAEGKVRCVADLINALRIIRERDAECVSLRECLRVAEERTFGDEATFMQRVNARWFFESELRGTDARSAFAVIRSMLQHGWRITVTEADLLPVSDAAPKETT